MARARPARTTPSTRALKTSVAELSSPSQRSSTRRPLWQYAVLYFAIFGVLLLVYQPVLHGGRLWDDDAHLTREGFKSLAGLWRIWFEPGSTQQYYPVVHSAFWVMAHLFGDSTVAYHVMNVALHSLSAVLVAIILDSLGIPGSICTAVLFAVHPVHVESVAWMTELKNTLSGVLCLSALLVYLQYSDTRKALTYLLSLVLFVLALLSKSVTATLPAVILVIAWLREGHVDLRRDVRPLIPFFCLGVAMGIVTTLVERTFVGASGTGFELSVIQRCLIAGRAVCFYLSKLLWPANLIFIYPRWQPNAAQSWQYAFPVAVLVLLGLFWAIRSWSRAPFAALLMYCLVLAPALGFVNVYPFKFSFVADHFQYLASVAILAFASASIFWPLRERLSPPWIAAIVVLVGALPLALVTRAQSREYADAATLYAATIRKNPQAWLAYNNRAMLALEGNPSADDFRRAVGDFEQALAIAPNEPTVRFNLGTALHKLQRYDDALTHLRVAVQVDPDYTDAWGNIGAALQQSGRFADALEPYQRALKLKPDLEWVRYNTSVVLLDLGRTDEAAAAIAGVRTTQASMQHRLLLAETFLMQGHYKRAIDEYQLALRVGPLPAEALNHLGYALLQERRPAEAEQVLRLSIAAQTDSAAAYSNLGNALQQLGRLDESLGAYRLALASPGGSQQPETHNDFGVALARAGRIDDAIVEFRAAVRLNPRYQAARDNLERALVRKHGS